MAPLTRSDAGSAPVLVAVALLEENQMAVGVRPAKKRRQVAVGGMRHRTRGSRVRQRRHKQIAHVIDRRQPGEVLAVGTDPHAADIRIVEENFSCDQFGRGRRRRTGERQRDAERGGVAQEIAAVDRDAVHANLCGPALAMQARRRRRRLAAAPTFGNQPPHSRFRDLMYAWHATEERPG